MEALGIDLKLIIVQIVNFTILLVILKRFLYKPILGMLDKRKEDAKESLALKNRLSEEMAGVEEKRKVMEHEAKQQADVLMDEARQKGDRLVNQMETAAKEKAATIVAKGEETLVQKEAELRDHVKHDVARVAIEVAETVVGQTLSEEGQRKITEGAVRRFVESDR